jgi:hypothetical protein
MLGLLQRLAPRSDLRENARTVEATVIDQRTDRAEEIDLLRDELICQKKILRQHDGTRVLLSDDAYAKIEEATRSARAIWPRRLPSARPQTDGPSRLTALTETT